MMSNDKKHNTLYFLHIAKNGGRYIAYNVINPILQELEHNKIKIIGSNKRNTPDHLNWHSKINDETYILTSLRDPVQQCISLYVHKKTTDYRGNVIKNNNFVFSKKDFYDTILSNNNYQNYQSKNFISDERRGIGLYKEQISVDEGLLQKRINRVNLLLNQNNLNSEKIQKKIFLDLGIKKEVKDLISYGNFYNPHSEYFFNQFSDAEKKSIRKYNEIDYYLYHNSSYNKV